MNPYSAAEPICNEEYCSKHKEYKNELICLTENKYICYKCTYHDCSKHQTKEINVLKNEKKEIFNSDINNLKNYNEKIKELFEQLKFEYEDVKKIKNNIIKEIDEKFDDLFNFLTETKKKLVKNIESILNIDDYTRKIKILSKYSFKDMIEEKNLILKNWEELNIISINNEISKLKNDLKTMMDIFQTNQNENNRIELSINNVFFLNIYKLIDSAQFLKIIEKGDFFYFNFQKGENYELNENKKIATKTKGGNHWNCNIFGDKELRKNKICKWKIKLKKFSMNKGNDWDILIGVGPYTQKNENYYDYCWSFICGCSKLSIKSGQAKDYSIKENRKLKEGDIIEVTMNMIKGELSFSVNDINYGIACTNIPVNIPLYPIVMIYDINESVELINV